MTAFVTPIYIKDIDNTRSRVSIWRQSDKIGMEFVIGKVYSFKNLLTDKYPDDKPHYLKTGYYSTITMGCKNAETLFSSVHDWDGHFEGMYLHSSYTLMIFRIILTINLANFFRCDY